MCLSFVFVVGKNLAGLLISWTMRLSRPTIIGADYHASLCTTSSCQAHGISRITDSVPEETDECIPTAAYPFVSDRNAARLDNNPMSPVTREPVNTIVERTADDNAPAYDGPDLTPVKFRRMNTLK